MTGKAGLAEAARSLLGLELTAAQRKDFDWYAAELIEWNRRFNLTAITDPTAIAIKHILDSLSCLLVMRGQAAGRVIDVGTGAGFPGLPLKIVRPRIELTLVEATGKKVNFCQHVVTSLRLEAVQVIHARAEEIGHWPDHRQAYDWALARAVATMPVLVEYLLPLLRIGGRAIAQKGETGPAEAHAADKALRLLGGRVQQVVPVELPTVAESHYLVVVEKTAATPDEYPRRPGIPVKRPLG